MKVAILLFGFVREWKQCKTSIQKHLIEALNADVFISTYDIPGYWTQNDIDAINFTSRNGCESLVSELRDAYHPKKLDIEVYDRKFREELDKEASRYPNKPVRFGRKPNIIGAFRKIQRCVYLMQEYEKENNFEYEHMIVCRPDVLIHHLSKFDLGKYDLLYHTFCGGDQMFYCDLLYGGHRKTMIPLCNSYKYIHEIVKQCNLFDAHEIFENAIKFALDGKNTYSSFEFSYEIMNTPLGYCKV